MFGFLSSLLGKEFSVNQILKYPDGKRYYKDFHPIKKHHIDANALKIINRLQQHKQQAWVVGGSLRDLLLGKTPKDFDVVTTAEPKRIRYLFSNSCIIGKRFKLVHVMFRDGKIIEVSTTRSLLKQKNTKSKRSPYLERDNQYGNLREDIACRDFTINSLLLDSRSMVILDYTGGFSDIENKIIRVIGNPDTSLPEDPVRMLRAIKFSSTLNFSIENATLKSIKKNRNHIKKVSNNRLREEFNKIFRTGFSSIVFKNLSEMRFLEAIFPKTNQILAKYGVNWNKQFIQTEIYQRLLLGDRMISEHEDINIVIYYSLLIRDIFQDYISTDATVSLHDTMMIDKIQEKLAPIAKEMALTRKECDALSYIFSTQHLFSQSTSKKQGWITKFKEKNYFLESFIHYKINARAQKDHAAIQMALFWEIGLRKKLPGHIRQVNRVLQDQDIGHGNRRRYPHNRSEITKPVRKKHY